MSQHCCWLATFTLYLYDGVLYQQFLWIVALSFLLFRESVWYQHIKLKGLCYQPFTPDPYQLVWYDLNFMWDEGSTAVEYGSTEKHHTGCSFVWSVFHKFVCCVLQKWQKLGGYTIYVTSFKLEQCPPWFQPCCTLPYYVIDEQLNLLFRQYVLASGRSTLFTKVQQRLGTWPT